MNIENTAVINYWPFSPWLANFAAISQSGVNLAFYKYYLKLSSHVSIDQIKYIHFQFDAIPCNIKTRFTSK